MVYLVAYFMSHLGCEGHKMYLKISIPLYNNTNSYIGLQLVGRLADTVTLRQLGSLVVIQCLLASWVLLT